MKQQTEPSAVAPGQVPLWRLGGLRDPALPRSVLFFTLYQRVSVVMMGLVMRVCLLGLMMLVCLPALAANAAADRETPGTPVRTASQLFRRHCVACHGNDGKAKTSKGRFNHARDLTDAQWQTDISDERIFNSIMNGRNGRGNMPAFADKLNEKQANSLVNFVRGFKGKQ